MPSDRSRGPKAGGKTGSAKPRSAGGSRRDASGHEPRPARASGGYAGRGSSERAPGRAPRAGASMEGSRKPLDRGWEAVPADKPAGKPGYKAAARIEAATKGGRPAAAEGRSGGRASRPPKSNRPTAPRERRPAPDLEAELPPKDIVFGRHPAIAALEGDRPVNKVWLLKDLKNAQLVAQIRQLAKEKGASVQTVERQKLDSLTLDANHQGIVVSIASASYIELEEAITLALKQDHPALLVLDGIEDPHNLGALIRTAEGAGFAAVVIPMRRAVGLTPTVAKASAGAVDRLPVARVGNLAQALQTLSKAGFWSVGADAEGEALPYDVDLTRALALVIGGEGKGLSRLLGERCDSRVRLPLAGALESLNASVAGGVLMYEAVRQRLKKV